MKAKPIIASYIPCCFVAEVADQLGISANSMAIAVMLGASAAWVNPYGYQCNLMVYTAGGYSFKEFALMGGPFQVRFA